MGGKVSITPCLDPGFSIIKLKLLFVRIAVEGNIVPAGLYCAAFYIFNRIEIYPKAVEDVRASAITSASKIPMIFFIEYFSFRMHASILFPINSSPSRAL